MRKGRHYAGKEGIAGTEGTAGKVLRNTEKEKKKQEKSPGFGKKVPETGGFSAFCEKWRRQEKLPDFGEHRHRRWSVNEAKRKKVMNELKEKTCDPYVMIVE